MNETKVIYLCGSRIGIPVMRDLLFSNQLAVLAIPGDSIDFIVQAKALLQNSTVAVISLSKMDYRQQLTDLIGQYQVNMGIVFGFSYKIPAAVFDLPAKGFFNIHPGALPAYRGPDPVFRQIINREHYATITIHKLDEGMDSGPIVMTDRILLKANDTHGMLTTKLAEAAARLTATLMKLAGLGLDIPSRSQDQSKATYYPRQTEKEVCINWQTMEAVDIIALVNACNPWNKGAITFLNNNVIKLLDGYVLSSHTPSSIHPGTIVSIDEKGVMIAVKGGFQICTTIIYMEEGFLPAARLAEIGIIPGMRFMD